MTPEQIKKAIKDGHEFRDRNRRLRGKVPYAGEYGISSGILTGPARELFVAEVSYQTLYYVVISDTTPLMWHGAFNWVMPRRIYMRNVDHENYLLILEAYDEIVNPERYNRQ